MKLLIPEDSPLRNPPADLDPVQKAACDGLRFAFDMTHVSYLRLVSVLEQIGQSMRAGSRSVEETTLALVDAWGVVDNLWRLHQVVRRFPHLKKSPPLEVHLRAIARVGELRHGIQHLDKRLRPTEVQGQPILGSLSWVWTPDEPLKGGFMMAVAAGAVREGWTPLVNPGGREFHRPIGLVTLSAFGHEIELTSLVVRVVNMAKGLDRGMRLAVGGKPGGGSDVMFAVHFEFAPPTPKANQNAV